MNARKGGHTEFELNFSKKIYIYIYIFAKNAEHLDILNNKYYYEIFKMDIWCNIWYYLLYLFCDVNNYFNHNVLSFC